MNIKSKGKQNNVIEIRLKENKPTIFNGCSTSGNHDQVYPHKFQGNPDKILLLTKSKKEKKAEKKSIDTKLFLINGPDNKFAKPKNKPRNKGRVIIEMGIKYFKFSSKERELEIQWVPDKKKPIPNK